MRAGQAHPAKLWLLARHPLAPEREAIQLAFGEKIPPAAGLQGGLALKGVEAHGGIMPLSGQEAFGSWLTADSVVDLNQGEQVPLERLAVRQEAWATVFRLVERLCHAQRTSVPRDLPKRLQDLVKGVAAIRKWDAGPETTAEQRQAVAALVVKEQRAAGFALGVYFANVYEGMAFTRWIEVPERWSDEAREISERHHYYLLEALEEIIVERWEGFTGELLAAAAPTQNLRFAEIRLDVGPAAELFYGYLQQGLLAWLRDEPLPDPPVKPPRPSGVADDEEGLAAPEWYG
jgi:hypothetical protein